MNLEDCLSDLFLDTELQPHDYRWIATQIQQSGLALEEVEKILIERVARVCAPNLTLVAGEWAGFPDGWVSNKLNDPEYMRVMDGYDHRKLFETYVRDDWNRVLSLVASDEARGWDES